MALPWTCRRKLRPVSSAPNLDPNVFVIALAGNGKGFCGGYDLVLSIAAPFGRG